MERIKLWENIPGMCEEEPVLEYYPAEVKKSKSTVVILPGGGYRGRANYEGEDYAKYFNSLGMDAFVCEYRVAPHRFPLPLMDARRAVQYVRYNAEKYGINPDAIGIMGSSAGGHLAATVCTLLDDLKNELKAQDEIDQTDYIPNFQILCYPVIRLEGFGHIGSGHNLLGDKDVSSPERIRLACDKNIHERTPKAFVWHTFEDATVNVKNSLCYVSALKDKGILAELHIFPNGRHGLGLAKESFNVSQWTNLLKNWLILNEWL
jgi:acetyl esterase/lipase